MLGGILSVPSRFPSFNSASRIRQFASMTNHLTNITSLQNTYCVIRHGRSLANESKVISSHPDVATIQHGLSEEGIKQAKAVGNDVLKYYHTLKSCEGIAILTSDYLRALETARYVFQAVASDNNIPLFRSDDVGTDQRLRERWFGEWDGRSDKHYVDVWKDDVKDSSHTVRGVESIDSVMERATEFVLEWDNKLSNHLILLVAHGDVLQITQTAFAKLSGTEHRNLEHLETATLRPLILKK